MDSCTAARAVLFDNLIGAGEQRGRHGDAGSLRSLEVDYEIKLGSGARRLVKSTPTSNPFAAACCSALSSQVSRFFRAWMQVTRNPKNPAQLALKVVLLLRVLFLLSQQSARFSIGRNAAGHRPDRRWIDNSRPAYPGPRRPANAGDVEPTSGRTSQSARSRSGINLLHTSGIQTTSFAQVKRRNRNTIATKLKPCSPDASAPWRE